MTRATPALKKAMFLPWFLATLALAVADDPHSQVQGQGNLRIQQQNNQQHTQRMQRQIIHGEEPLQNPQRSMLSVGSRTENVSEDDPFLDSDYARFMRNAMVTRMIVQEMNMADESLVLGGIIISLRDDVLQALKLSTDGRNVNMYECITKEVIDNNLVVQVLKRDGVVYSVVQYRRTSSLVICAVPIPGRPDKYATFSTNDWDRERLNKLIDEVILFRQSNIFRNPISGTISDHVNNGGRKLDDVGTCNAYRVLRVDVRFDSDFCRVHGGRQGAIDRVHAIIAAANRPYNESPLCMKVVTCNVDGFCFDEDEPSDPFRKMIDESALLCKSVTGNSLSDKFRDYMYAPFDEYVHNGQCDTAHLLYGGNYEPPEGVFQSTGCASIGALCDTFAYGVNHVGIHSQNLPAQAGVVAHELGHNVNSEHDTDEGYIMYALNCIDCTSFSPPSIRNMTTYADLVQFQNPGTCLGVEQPPPPSAVNPPVNTASSTRSPTSSPTFLVTSFSTESPQSSRPPSQEMSLSPSSSPSSAQTPAPTKGDLCRGVFKNKKKCNKKSKSKCTWRPDKKECWQRKDMECEFFTVESLCINHGQDCGWQNKKCFAPCADLDRSNCDESKYCTWRRKSCRARHELKCKKFRDEFRCEAHGTFCTWNTNKKKCFDLKELPPDVDSCGIITSAFLCNKDKFDVCTWDYSSDTCRHKDDMTCAEHIRSKSCNKDGINCKWDSDESICQDSVV